MPKRAPAAVISNSAADRAGDQWRRWAELRGMDPTPPADITKEDLAKAIDAILAITAYRAMHSYPMTKVTMGVRSMIQTATRSAAVRPGQRFKRIDRIVNKLQRYPRMRLSQMEDIGGCRAVLPHLEQVHAVAARIRRRWPHARFVDYIEEPKADGYRGIHIIERRDGRLIEVQLRTPGQHQWAETIEVYSPRLGFNLKDGEGPADLREYFRQASNRIAREERGEPPDPTAELAFSTLRRRVLPYFDRRRTS